MLAQCLPLHVGSPHRKRPGIPVVKVVLIVAAVTAVLSIFRGWGGTLASKAKQTVFHHKDPPDNTLPYGDNRVSIAAVEFLGIQTSNNSCSRRDLGFTGKLGDHWYAIHGDALWCAPGVTDGSGDVEFRGMVRNTISLLTDDVLKPYDLYIDDTEPVPHPRQFFEFNREWGEHQLTGFGGTSICAMDDTSGAVYYAVNDPVNGMIGAGVAKVELIWGGPNITVTERFGENGIWWPSNDNPRYGDIAAYRDDRSDYIYLLGGAPNSAKDYKAQGYVYQARVHYRDAFDLSKYEYWHGRQTGWSSALLKTFNSETAVMWNVGQGQIVWSEHLYCYVFVHTNPGSNQVVLRTASAPDGPWSDDLIVYCTKVANDGGMVYAGVAHPYLDPSGKTLTVTYTNHPNIIEAIKVTFK